MSLVLEGYFGHFVGNGKLVILHIEYFSGLSENSYCY